MSKVSQWPQVSLGDVIASVKPGFASGERSEEGTVQFRMNNVDRSGNIIWDAVTRVPADTKKIMAYGLEPGDVLFNQTNSRDLVGKTAFFKGHLEPVVFSNHFLRLRPDLRKAEGSYLSRYLQGLYLTGYFSKKCNAWVNQATYGKDDLLALRIPLPPLAEQRRIAAILDKADAIRRKRQHALALADDFLRSAFLEMFGDPVTNPKGWQEVPLEDVATINSGLTKGRKLTGRDTVSLPYMRVANVQDGHLNLANIKYIELAVEEVPRFLLQPGDVLLTEGGDPDKLGRGAVWDGQIENCDHQNHIFRVSCDRARACPEFVSAQIGSQRGKSYFLRSAKQTTGIATINKTQLKAFPLLLPPLPLQEDYVRLVAKIEAWRQRLSTSEKVCGELFASLSQRAFRGGVGRG